jgi:YD repeat-containing protein
MASITTRNTGTRQSRVWHSMIWGLLLLAIFIAFIVVWKAANRPAKVELLPFTESPPVWNGSHPYLVLSQVDLQFAPASFRSSIREIAPTLRHDSLVNEFQVDLHSGMFVLRQTDLFISDAIPLSLTRTYRVWDSDNMAFGVGTNHPYDICPTGTRSPYTYMDLNLEDGQQVRFRRISKGTGFANAVYRHDETSSEFYGAQIAWNGNGWTLGLHDGRHIIFPESYDATNRAQGAPVKMLDAHGHGIQVKRDKKRNVERLISASGHTITFKYDRAGRIIEAMDDSGNVRNYSYNSSGHLESVADASHLLYRFAYEQLLQSPGYDPYLLTEVVDGRGKVLLQNAYAVGGRISEQRLADGQVYRYDYLLDKKYEILETTVSGPRGKKKFIFQGGIVVKEE